MSAKFIHILMKVWRRMALRAVSRVSAAIDNWVAAASDPGRQQGAVLQTLAGYAAIWTLYRMVSTIPRDLNPDVTELYAWARDLAFGYDKHPPFSAAVAKVWLALLPVSDLTFHLLATCNIALTLYIAWRTMLRYMDGEKSAFGLLLLMLIPFFNFQALKYNANAVLLPLWAATIYCFLRALEHRKALWSALAGAAAGASMLGKYWSIVLVATLGLAALFDARRASFFRSPAPWIMIGVGALVLAPHLVWLAGHHYAPFSHAVSHSTPGFAATLLDTAQYLAGCVGYIATPVVLTFVLLRPPWAALSDVAAPADPTRRLLLTILLLLNLLPAPLALLGGIRIVPLWTMPGWSLLPLVLLASSRMIVNRRAVGHLAGIVLFFTLSMLALSPGIALAIHVYNPPGPSEYASLLAEKIAEQWHHRSAMPVPLVAGEGELAMSAAYYLRTHSRIFEGADPAALKAAALANGAVLVCPAANAGCLATAEQIVSGQSEIARTEVRLARPLFGVAGGTVRDVFWLVLPPERR